MISARITGFLSFLWDMLKAAQIFVFGILSIVTIAALIGALVSIEKPEIPDGGALVLNPRGALVEQKSAFDPQRYLQTGDMPKQTLVKDIIDALALAKNDDRIQYLVLDLDGLGAGYISKLQRIASAIDDFKTSGKKVITIGSLYSQSALLLAAHADEVLMDPEGAALPEGYGMYRTYYKTILENFDVTINLFKVGKYKSAMEPYFRDNMSDEDKQARMGILNNWWSAYTADFEESRGMPVGTLDAQLNDAKSELAKAKGNLAQLAVEGNLVDRLSTDLQSRDYLIELAGKDDESGEYRHIGFEQYLELEREPEELDGNKIAVITAVGSIVDGSAEAGSIGSRTFSKLIRKAAKDEDVKAIVLRVDSGGGSKTASEVIRRELEVVQASGKPVIASMGSVAASGGYWISATADEIWASSTTITGSIGIFAFIPTLEETMARYGIYSDGVGTTPLTGGGSLERGFTPLYADLVQTVIDAGYQQFLETVAKGRDMTAEQVHEIAQGRVWSGEKALELGLVDKLGDLEQAIEAAAALAKIEEYGVWYVEPEVSSRDRIIKDLMAEAVAEETGRVDPIARIQAKLEQEFGFLSQMNDPRGIYVICTSCLVE